MTEYELVDTFYTIAGLSDQLIASFITLLFAFLVASYLVSSKLDRRMTAVVIALYSFMALRYVALFYKVTDDIVALADTLTELRLRGGSSLEWLEISDGISTMLIMQTVAMILGFAASIFFFFYMRHHGNE
jgi:cellobiose-specific phosphotransferase system component IIC